MRRAKQGPLPRWQKRNSIYGLVPKKEKKEEKRHSVFLFSLLLVFILSYWPTTLASLRSRPEPYSTSNNNNIQSISIWDFFRNRVILFTARGVFLFRLVCPFRSPLSFTHVRPKNQQAISLWKHFLQNSILGKNFLKKKWSGLCWLDDWPNWKYISQHQMRNEKTCLVFRERRGFFPRLGEHLFDAQGFATFKEVDKPHSVLLFRALWRITSFVGRWNVSLNWSEFARLFGVVYKMFSGSSCCCWIINQVPPSIEDVANLILNLFFWQGQQHNHNERDELIARERKLQVLVDDLRETMRHQQDTFAHEKKELVICDVTSLQLYSSPASFSSS